MQTRTSGVMHQYPLRVASGFQTCQHGIGTLITAIYNGDLRMIRQEVVQNGYRQDLWQ